MCMESPGIAKAWLNTSSAASPGGGARRVHWSWLLSLAALIWVMVALSARAEDPAAPADTAVQTQESLDTDVQSLKQQVVDLNRDLFLLEEELLFPANTQLAVFVSMDVGSFFALDSVKLVVDGKEVANYLYTQREVEALLRGGVHRVWVGNLKTGEHEVTAFFTGKGPHDRDYRRGATVRVTKNVGAKYLELKISDRETQLQPEFSIKEWE